MQKLYYLKNFFPFLIALVLHGIFFSIFLFPTKELRYPTVRDLTAPKKYVTFNLKNTTINSRNIPQKPNNFTNKIERSHTSNKTDIDTSNISPSHQLALNESSKDGGPNETISDFIYYENPIYPPLARMKNIEGFIEIEIIFDQTGNVSNWNILKSSGSKILEEEVLIKIKKWRIKASHPTKIIKKFEFKLNN